MVKMVIFSMETWGNHMKPLCHHGAPPHGVPPHVIPYWYHAAQAIARARHEPDLVAVRRLEALLNWQLELGSKSAAAELGVLPFLEHMLKEFLGATCCCGDAVR